MHQQSGLRCRGLDVTVYDPDTVSPFNVGRQLFYTSDVGLGKAEVLVNRVNVAYGTQWKAVSEEYQGSRNEDGSHSYGSNCDLVITCVDTAAARREVHRKLWTGRGDWSPQCDYWLDCGNLSTVGHAILGQPGRAGEEGWPKSMPFRPEWAMWRGQWQDRIEGSTQHYKYWFRPNKLSLRLPCVTELYPEMMDEGYAESNEPSCSMVDALEKQSLFVNRTVSAYALDLLWQLIREGRVDNQGVIFNLRTRVAQPVPLKVWPLT